MKVYAPWLMALALPIALLAGCGREDAPPQARDATPLDVPAVPVMGREIGVLALGDSLFTGYGLDGGQSYPAALEAALRARGINAKMANAGVSGDTSAGALQRLKFTLDSQPAPPEVVVISIGGNDMLRGLPPEETRANIDAILAELKRRRMRVVLLGMIAAPNLGKDYAAAFNPIYPALAKKHGAALVPFFLQPLVEKPALVQADHVHPTEAGIGALVAGTVDAVAKAMPWER